MHDKFKNLIWIVLGGYIVGISIRRGWDSINGIPSFVDTPLLDIDSILYGASFIFLCIWLVLTGLAIIEHKPWKEAKEHWDRYYPDRKSKFKFLWLLFRWQNTVFVYLSIYFFVAYLFCFALSGGVNKDGNIMFFVWCGLVFLNWVYYIGVQKKWFAIEPDTLEKNTATILDLPVKNGRFVVIAIIVSLLFGIVQYPRISQAFGGGKPEKAIVFLKKDTTVVLPTQTSIEGQVVELAFRRGTKMGFRTKNSLDKNFIVIDQDQIDRLYVGSNINRLFHDELK